jgi:hypothetical protein
VAALAAALESLRRGVAPATPQPPPTGELARAWAAVEQLGRFLAMRPGDIRLLAERPVGPLPGEASPAPGGRMAGSA